MQDLSRFAIEKYPRTLHLEDSRLQDGDEGMGGIPFAALREGNAVYEEKVDGANCGFRFDGAGDPWAQSRGHYLDLGDRSNFRERHFNLFKEWVLAHRDTLLGAIEDRFVCYGENMQVAHTVYYDRLPHYFLEFDTYDLAERRFLDTPTRRRLYEGTPVVSVPVCYSGDALDLAHLKAQVGRSFFRSAPAGPDGGGWEGNLERSCGLVGDDYAKRLAKMDRSDTGEGIYVKVERDGGVAGRYKWVRSDFTQAILAADEHWQSRLPVPNLLEGVTDIFPVPSGEDSLRHRASAYDPDMRPGCGREPTAPMAARAPIGRSGSLRPWTAEGILAGFLPGPPGWGCGLGRDSTRPSRGSGSCSGSTQDPVHHAEGDVHVHVGMVLEELAASPEFRAADEADRLTVFTAAMLHDVCKPETREVQPDGRITNKHHSRMGANEARQILWRMGAPFADRERVCALIAVHQVPFWLIEKPEADAVRTLASTSMQVENRLLAMLAEADARGRVCADRRGMVDNVELFREAARDNGCYDGPFPFHNDHARMRYFRDPDGRDPRAELWDTTDPGFTVTLMSGLPASGKSTWIARETSPGGSLAGQPVVSMDRLRTEMRVRPQDDQGGVRQEALARARKLLAAREPFVWDALNLDWLRRQPVAALCADYGARVRFAYVEAREDDMMARNRAREARLPDSAIMNMLRKWDPPSLVECHSLALAVPAAAPAPARGWGR